MFDSAGVRIEQRVNDMSATHGGSEEISTRDQSQVVVGKFPLVKLTCRGANC